jgi:GT2 family glycosyltransferase
MSHHIEAISVNHNTSPYMELMLRSLAAHHGLDLDLTLTVVDNASEDGTSGLRDYAARMGIPIVQSGFSTTSLHNSHGEILRRFVLEHPDSRYYLFLDSDLCFLADDTLAVMREELDAVPEAFGIGPRMSWDGIAELPQEVSAGNPDIYEARLHPCCALIKNTEIFRGVVREIGLSCARYLWAEREEYFDTCTLMTRVMRTHGLRHIISAQMVLHFFCTSYDWDLDHVKRQKDAQCWARLTELRALDT